MTDARPIPDPATEAGAQVIERLERELIAWLTTVSPAGQPQSSPIWFLWADGDILMYSRLGAPRTRNVAAQPRVSLNLNTDGDGDEVVTFEAEARIDPDAPPASAVPGFIAKYRRLLDEYGWSAEKFSADYPTTIRIRPTRLRLA